MSNNPNDGQCTGDILGQQRRIRLQLSIDADRDDLAASKPDRWYTRTCLATGIAAGVDWTALAIHTVYNSSDNLDAILSTHQVVFVVLNVAAVVLLAVRAYWSSQCKRDIIRDRIAWHAQELQLDEIRRIRLDAAHRDQSLRDAKWTQVGEEFRTKFAELRAVGDRNLSSPPDPTATTVLQFPGPRSS